MQRRRGQAARVWRTKVVTDNRGNKIKAADPDSVFEVRAVFIPQRSARAEVPGQQQINVVRMLVSADLDDVDLWSRVEWNGKLWDVVTPPAHHHGSRHTRHWSIDLRERP
ncbi:phage head-tail adapter protein [Micromonospora sp. CB01531]|uniref:phage head-tail adapter protein n=1 Tax=Micromonospora sp. CB01531 TaxID=1718947 RepID=UPI00093E99B3|nr:phage head-tail adapter protein [Micromonospora sp. CB01531]